MARKKTKRYKLYVSVKAHRRAGVSVKAHKRRFPKMRGFWNGYKRPSIKRKKG